MFKSLHQILHAHAGEVIASLVGALAGALTAYWLQRWNENRRDREDKRAAIVSAQVLLTAQINTLKILWEKHLKPHESTPQRERGIGPIFFSERDPLIDIKSLVFLITRKDPNITFAVHLAQRSYISATDALRYRNDLHEKLFREGTPVQIGDAGDATIIGADKRIVIAFKTATDELFKSFPAAIARCEEVHRELRRIGLQRFSSWYSKRFSKSGFLRLAEPAAGQSRGAGVKA